MKAKKVITPAEIVKWYENYNGFYASILGTKVQSIMYLELIENESDTDYFSRLIIEAVRILRKNGLKINLLQTK